MFKIKKKRDGGLFRTEEYLKRQLQNCYYVFVFERYNMPLNMNIVLNRSLNIVLNLNIVLLTYETVGSRNGSRVGFSSAV